MNKKITGRVGELIDTVENYLTLQQNHLMPTATRSDAALSGLGEIRKTLIDIYEHMGGEYDHESPVSKSFGD